VSRTLKYDFYGSFLDSFNLQREFVGNVVMPDTRAVEIIVLLTSVCNFMHVLVHLETIWVQRSPVAAHIFRLSGDCPLLAPRPCNQRRLSAS